eukprot:GFYU01000660.1.p1 GENE.GFYU01000660.1~~GFYU01000660.1.p1  ORF type:complete len:545 (+),score=131.06 GFYU01000660.1:77-1711(+)
MANSRFNKPVIWGSCCFSFGIVLILLGALIPPYVITPMVNEQLCDNLCGPTNGGPEWKLNTWKDNYSNSTVHPPEYKTFWVYNITNPLEFAQNYTEITNHTQCFQGTKAVVRRLGPYVYRHYYNRGDLKWPNGDDNIQYNQADWYEFVPEMSTGDQLDSVYTINLSVLAGMNAIYDYQREQYHESSPAMTLGGFCQHQAVYNFPQSVCLAARRTVKEVIFNRVEKVAELLGIQNRFDVNFQLFFNCSSVAECRNLYRHKHMFGLGGNITKAYYNNWQVDMPQDAAYNGRSLEHNTYTGHGDLDNIGQFERWYNNDTLYLQQSDGSTVEFPVQGTDGYQFSPNLHEGNDLYLMNDDVTRPLKLQYHDAVKRSSKDGGKLYRFVTSDANFDDDGLMDLFGTHNVRYGAPAPLVGSRFNQHKVSDEWRSTYSCVNCPQPSDDDDTRVDIDPETGTTVHMSSSFQLNAFVGGKDLFCKMASGPAESLYNNLPPTLLPILAYKRIYHQPKNLNSERTGTLRLREEDSSLQWTVMGLVSSLVEWFVNVLQ